MSDQAQPRTEILGRVLATRKDSNSEDLRELVRLWEAGVTDEGQLTELLKIWKPRR